MIKLENVEVYGWEAAIRGMRNPMNSWEKSDSRWSDHNGIGRIKPEFLIGDNDLKLMQNLRNAGSDHGKFMRFIAVTLDIVAPLYWWKEFDTYKVGTVANSCSTMHKIAEKEFTLDNFSHEHLMRCPEECWDTAEVLEQTITWLNIMRANYLSTNDKQYWWQMIQLLPSSYNQKRTVQLNYEVLRNMYHARKAHKLDCWIDFCKWIENLPYSELICE